MIIGKNCSNRLLSSALSLTMLYSDSRVTISGLTLRSRKALWIVGSGSLLSTKVEMRGISGFRHLAPN
ncbi:UNVERIFIED_CONTAM: hypothetical protein NY603_29580, partial [Bacteroidetes bacterium 56_B9]